MQTAAALIVVSKTFDRLASTHIVNEPLQGKVNFQNTRFKLMQYRLDFLPVTGSQLL